MRNKKKWIAIASTILLGVGIVGCGNGADSNDTKTETTDVANETKETDNKDSKEEVELHVLAAASMTDVMTELGDLYEKDHPEVTLSFSFDSSGTLQTQIEEGAPADLFFSAALKQMNALKEKQLMEEDSIIELLENKVVLIQPKGEDIGITSFEDVASDKVPMVAIGNSDVPVGQYTEMIYENLGLWEEIEKKANFGTNVRQVLDWVATKNADCGIVYATDAAIEENVEVICEAPEGSCDPAIYPAGIVKATEYKEQAEQFLDFIKSEEAKEIFEKYQFTYIYSE